MRRCAWKSPGAALARAREELGDEWFKRFRVAAIGKDVDEWINSLPVVREMGREWFYERMRSPLAAASNFEVHRVAFKKMCVLAEKIEALKPHIEELAKHAEGALSVDYDEPGGAREYVVIKDVEEFLEAYWWIHTKTRTAAKGAREALRRLPEGRGAPRMVAKMRGGSGRREFASLSADEVSMIAGRLIPRRSDFARAVLESWSDAPRGAAAWAYFGIGTEIDDAPATTEEWDSLRAAWRTEIRRAESARSAQHP